MRVYYEPDNPGLDNEGYITVISVEPVTVSAGGEETTFINYTRDYSICERKELKYLDE